MATFKRFFALVMIGALTQFSAIGPLHSHSEDHLIAAVHQLDPHLDDDHAHADAHDDDGFAGSEHGDHDSGFGAQGLHAHVLPQFVTAHADFVPRVDGLSVLLAAAPMSAGVVLRAPSPPLRPPRASV